MSELSAIPPHFDVSIEWRQFRPDPRLFAALSPANRYLIVRELRRIDNAGCCDDDDVDEEYRSAFGDEDGDGEVMEDDETVADDPKKLSIVFARLVRTIPSRFDHRRLDLPVAVALVLFPPSSPSTPDNARTSAPSASSTTSSTNKNLLSCAMEQVFIDVRLLEQRVQERDAALTCREVELSQREKTADARIAAQAAEQLKKTQAECEKLLQEANAAKQLVQLEREKWEEEKRMIAKTQCFGEPNSRVKISVGGTLFETRLNVLTSNVAKDTMLGAMFSGRHRIDIDDKTGTVLIDRDDAEVFRLVLNYLRDPATFEVDSKYTDDELASLYELAKFYVMPAEFNNRVKKFMALEAIQFAGESIRQHQQRQRQQQQLQYAMQRQLSGFVTSNVASAQDRGSSSSRTRGWLDVQRLEFRCDDNEFVIDCRLAGSKVRISAVTLTGQYVICSTCGNSHGNSQPLDLVIKSNSNASVVRLALNPVKQGMHENSNLFVFEQNSNNTDWLGGKLRLSLSCESCRRRPRQVDDNDEYHGYNSTRNQSYHRGIVSVHGLFGEVSVPYAMYDAVKQQADRVRSIEQTKN